MSEKKESRPVPAEPFGEPDLFRDWSPFREWGGRGMSRLFDDMFGERGRRVERWSPAVDIAEDDHAYAVTVELPGAQRDDVTVEVHDNVISIRGEKRSEREEKKEQRRWIERTYGSFSRSFTLPPDADGENVKARFEEGVLTVEIPKREEAKPKVISIKS